MRALAVTLVILLAGTVSASPPPPPDPQIYEDCVEARSLASLTECFRPFGEPTALWGTATLKLFAVKQARWDRGVFLYRLVGTTWKLSGMTFDSDGFLAIESVTIGKHAGYRLEFGRIRPTQVILDDSSPVAGTIAAKSSLYCRGDTISCTEVITACDIVIKGKAYRTFRGTVTINKDYNLDVSGDRTKAGDCASPERVNLGWQ
jgi:hypothetical protein